LPISGKIKRIRELHTEILFDNSGAFYSTVEGPAVSHPDARDLYERRVDWRGDNPTPPIERFSQDVWKFLKNKLGERDVKAIRDVEDLLTQKDLRSASLGRKLKEVLAISPSVNGGMDESALIESLRNQIYDMMQ